MKGARPLATNILADIAKHVNTKVLFFNKFNVALIKPFKPVYFSNASSVSFSSPFAIACFRIILALGIYLGNIASAPPATR